MKQSAKGGGTLAHVGKKLGLSLGYTIRYLFHEGFSILFEGGV